jgi:hypothetical protein
MLLFLINAVFRGAGDATIAMRSLWLANAVNVVLDPCLIFGLGPFPELGVTGAAIGTTVGRSVGVAYQLRALGSPHGRLSIERRHLRLDRGLMQQLAKLSVGGVGQFLIGTASWLGLVRILTPFGAAALAGYTIALRIIIVALLPSWGMSNAVATLVGQNLGARKPERAERGVWIVGLYNMAFLLAVMVVFLWWAEPLIAVFTSDPAVQALGAECLRVVSYGYAFYAWGMVLVQAFNGAGDTTTPTWINLGCYWLFQIPLVVAPPRLGYGLLGVFLAITLASRCWPWWGWSPSSGAEAVAGVARGGRILVSLDGGEDARELMTIRLSARSASGAGGRWRRSVTVRGGPPPRGWLQARSGRFSGALSRRFVDLIGPARTAAARAAAGADLRAMSQAGLNPRRDSGGAGRCPTSTTTVA